MLPLAIYIHWPFCQSKCPYCDFNSHVRKSIPSQQYLNALTQEIVDGLKDRSKQGLFDSEKQYHITSVFFGGGTPSLMAPEFIGQILAELGKYLPFHPNVEITLEANPTSVEYKRFKAFRANGINRISLGVQSLDDHWLKFLGRPHDAKMALQAIQIAKENFDQMSFDLIYGINGQSLEALEGALEQALSLAGSHISLYQLTIEHGTDFMRQARLGKRLILESDEAALHYKICHDFFADKGLMPYEISNFAQEGAQAKHNLTYWRYQDYIGFGAGAHSRTHHHLKNVNHSKTLAFSRHRLPEKYMEAAMQGDSIAEKACLTPKESFMEASLMGLRLAEGLSEAHLMAVSGDDFLNFHQEYLEKFIGLGWLSIIETAQGRFMRTNMDGKMRLDAILSHIL